MLKVENLTKFFEKGREKIVALDDVSFEIEEGEIVGLLGPNGSGKTTLINLLIGFYLPDKGDVKLFGKSVYKNPDLIRKYVRTPFLIEDPRFTVYEVLKLTSKFFGVKNWKEKIEEWLNFFEIEDEKNTEIQKLSSGNYQKVRIIGALISEPKLLLLDEITNGLDLMAANKLIELLKKVNKEYNVSILFASHIFSHVEKLCERVIIIHRGKVLADNKIENLIKEAKLKEYITIKTNSGFPKDFLELLKKDFEVINISENLYKIVCNNASEELKKFIKILSNFSTLNQYIEEIKIKEITLEDVFAYFVSSVASKEK